MQPSLGSKDSPVQPGRMNWAFGCGWGRLGKARQGKGGTLDEGCEAVRISVQKHTIDELVEWIYSLPMESEVPTNFSYSNSGYILLGKIIETVSGSTYADFLEREIFGPAGKKDSALESSSILSNRASAYEMTAEGELRNARTSTCPTLIRPGALSLPLEICICLTVHWMRGSCCPAI
ncbi:serine hydrolase [Paenibacillus glucanolyticus]|uniref:serine hydrolase n=2 Tax=Paenibacillus TaxID=44249 RepID=UPI0018846DC8|nr:serine hydrolase domain-containing protein [Paenibacillus glucanolyticus]